MENIIRRIVAEADINVITRRLVRIEYMKLTGTEKLSAAEKKLIKAVLEKIIAEIAQKMRHQLHSDSTVSDNVQQKVSPGKDNVIAELLEAGPQHISSQKFTNESLQVSEAYEQFSSPTKGVNDSPGKDNVIAQLFIDQKVELGPQNVSIQKCTNESLQVSEAYEQFSSPTKGVNHSPGKDNGIAQLFIDQKGEARPQSVSTQKLTNESLQISEAYEQFSSPTKGVSDSFKNKSTERSFVLTHPLCSNKEWSPRLLCAQNKQSKLITPSEALICVLDSDATSSDNSHSDFCDTPQKNTTRDRILNKLDVKGSPVRGVNDRDEKRNAKTLNIVDINEMSESGKTLSFNKKYKTQNLDLNNTCVVNDDDNLPPTNSNLSPVNGRSVHTFFRELCSTSSILYTPENSCKSSLDFLQMNSQKCRQDCVIDSSSDTLDSHLADVNLVNNPDSLSDQEQFAGNVKHKKKMVHVIASSSDSDNFQESCASVAQINHRSQLDGGDLFQQVAVRVLLPKIKELNSSSNEPHTDALLGSEVMSTHHRLSGQDNDNCVPFMQTESSACHASTSSDTSLPSSDITRARFKIGTRKRVFDYSDSELENSGSPKSNTSDTSSQNNSSDKSPQSNTSDKLPQNNTSDESPQNNMFDRSQNNTSDKSQNNISDRSPQNNTSDKSPQNNLSNSSQNNMLDKSLQNNMDKSLQNNMPDKSPNNKPYRPNRNGKHSYVRIQIVDSHSYDVEVIKRGDLNDTELLEIIEKNAEEKFSSCISKKRKSLSRSKHFNSKKQRLMMLESDSCNVQDCDLDKSFENSTSSQSMEHSEDLSQTSKSTKSVYDFSSDDVEYDMPFSSLKSYRNYVSGGSASVSLQESKLNKCFVAISRKEKQLSDDAQNYSHSDSSHQVGLSDSGSSSISESSQKDPLSRLKHTTGYPKNDGSDSSYGNTSDSYSRHSDSDKQASTSKGHIPHDSVSDSSVSVDSLSSSSHISSACSSQSETTHSMTKKSCQNETLTEFRITCEEKRLDLAGCSIETNNNTVKKLLEKRGVQDIERWQILEKIQIEKQKLLEKMKKLGADKITFNNMREDIHERKINGSPFGNDDSYREHHDTIQADSPDVFSNVKDIIVIDDSDS